MLQCFHLYWMPALRVHLWQEYTGIFLASLANSGKCASCCFHQSRGFVCGQASKVRRYWLSSFSTDCLVDRGAVWHCVVFFKVAAQTLPLSLSTNLWIIFRSSSWWKGGCLCWCRLFSHQVLQFWHNSGLDARNLLLFIINFVLKRGSTKEAMSSSSSVVWSSYLSFK